MKYLEKYNRYIDNDCVIYRKDKEGKLVQVKATVNGSGYEFITCKGQNKVSVHRLVYEAFKGEIPEGMEIDHIDRNKRNNNPDNLRVVTHKENMLNRSYPSNSSNHSYSSEFGRKFIEHFGIKRYDNIKLYDKELHWYRSHNNRCRWE